MALPNGWESTSFMDVFEIQGGTQPPKNVFIYEEKEGYIRLLQIRDFGEKPVPTYIPINKNLKRCNTDDILIGRYGASVGRICTGMEGAYNVALAKVLIPYQIDKRFVYYLLQSEFFQKPILSIERSAQDGFNKDDLTNIEVPIAPYQEQKKIVKRLELLLPKVQICQERLDKIPAILKRFRQTVLAAACSGRLTEDWREKNFGEFQKNWDYVFLKDVADLRLGKMLDKSKNKGRAIKYLRNVNVRWMDFNLSDIYTILAQDEEIRKLSIENGDVLVCEGGEPGRAAVWKMGENDFIFQKALHRVRLNKDISADWFVYNLKKDADSGFLSDLFTGTTIKHLTGESLAKYRFPKPPFEEQIEIVNRVEALFNLADKIEARYTKIYAYLNKVTQSIFSKAFRGELVPQDPNDEPASVLLERIKKEKKDGGRVSGRRRIESPHSGA